MSLVANIKRKEQQKQDAKAQRRRNCCPVAEATGQTALDLLKSADYSASRPPLPSAGM